MKELLQTLNKKIIINHSIIDQMRYDISMLSYDQSSKNRARILAKKIHAQLDQSLKSVEPEDREAIKKLLLLNSFLVLPNPVSDRIHYGHVFTTLTNFDDNDDDTKERLVKWLDSYTDVSYDEASLTQYIKSYKIKSTGKIVKTAASTYVPAEKDDSQTATEAIYRYRPTRRAFLIPVAILVALLIYSLFHLELYEKPRDDMAFIQPLTYDDGIEHRIIEELKDVPKVNIRIIPEIYRYKEPNLKALYTYLENKESMLIRNDYLSTINSLAKDYHIHPYLLIAIIGQEQGFVPYTHEEASTIINNPYNVFGSWQTFNTNFEEATTICLNTINTALANRPDDIDLIEFLNKKYSEDERWYIGVQTIFQTLNDLN